MILSNVEIHRALDEGRLVLDPEPNPRVPGLGVDCPYQASAVDLSLGDEVSWLKPGLPLNIDLRGGGFAKLFGPNSERRTIKDDQPYMLGPASIALYPRQPVCQLIVEMVSGTPIRNDSQFQGQSAPGGRV
jgi:deoxycytidine triphosphate deaminase